MAKLYFQSDSFKIYPSVSRYGEDTISVFSFDKEYRRWYFVEAVSIENTESVQEVFDKVVAKYTRS